MAALKEQLELSANLKILYRDVKITIDRACKKEVVYYYYYYYYH